MKRFVSAIFLVAVLGVISGFAERKKPTLAQCHADSDALMVQGLNEPTYDELMDITNEMWACERGSDGDDHQHQYRSIQDAADHEMWKRLQDFLSSENLWTRFDVYDKQRHQGLK